MTSPHRVVNPPELGPPVGFSHAIAASPGTTIHLGGQTGHRGDGTIAEGLLEQFDQACANVVTALRATGAEPGHLVSLQIFTTVVEEYRSLSRQLGEAYRRHLGRHYPAAALLGVKDLYDPAAKVELMVVAVLPD